MRTHEECERGASPYLLKLENRATPALPVGREYHRALVLHFFTDDFPKVTFSIWIHSRAWFILLGKMQLNVHLHSKSDLPHTCALSRLIIRVMFSSEEPQDSLHQYRSGRRIIFSCIKVLTETSHAPFKQKQASLTKTSILAALWSCTAPW